MPKIPWKTINIETLAQDGTPLKGELRFWSKDYCFVLKSPFSKESSSHMMYMIPAKFVYEPDKPERYKQRQGNTTVHCTNLFHRRKEVLCRMYEAAKKEKGIRSKLQGPAKSIADQFTRSER